MQITLNIPDSIPLDPQVTLEFRCFLQAMVNRRCVGALRCGDRPRKSQRYQARLQKELNAYKKGGGQLRTAPKHSRLRLPGVRSATKPSPPLRSDR